MIFFGLVLIVFAGYLGYKIKRDSYERTNPFSTNDNYSFENKLANAAKNGALTSLSIVSGLIGTALLIGGLLL